MEEVRGKKSRSVGAARTLDERYVEDLISYYGWIKGFHIIGFCRFWLLLDRRPLAELVKELEARGLGRTTAYRLMRELLAWCRHVEEREGLKEGTLTPEIAAERLVRATSFSEE
jgi:hypothetical protein